ncbi:malate-2H(+)/Na(+)-lactate antiporter [Andreesenia angusta]|uniref:Malate-2H(+)/Na(+)-lactate antiporter n=1 Tax=Andreesenia angusta TaxID=39480 RepID=A0A1S1V6Y6_9FIRM|nr:Na+/H+ antiporter NhaC family protein [Andreesenia angusta]OHW62302.1 malate-2H(+)/Na(+)-lactate antiporter [Andreesenia angusta]
MKDMELKKGNPIALVPLAVFLVLFLGSGIYFNSIGAEMAFYQFPSPVAATVGVIVAFFIGKKSMGEKVDSFMAGAGNENIMTMCIIYILAGGFSAVASSMGGVDSIVNFGLSIIPPSFIVPGLFLIAAFIATAMGTSMGTIGAVVPIAVSMASAADIPVAISVGAVVGGALFGDNLSMISDTTIAATRTQGCEMKDKFVMNFKIALPAAVLSMVIMAVLGSRGEVPSDLEYSLLKIIPYISVLVMALMKVNVFVVLFTGTALAGAIGLWDGSFSPIALAQTTYEGYQGMMEIFLLSILIGGLANMMSEEGGIDYLIHVIKKRIKSRKGAEYGIGALVSIADICTANNTVAIVLTGSMAKKVSEEYDVDPRRSASILDIFSCVFQGIIPYGAQLLLAGSIAKLSPVELMPYLYYPYILGVITILAIALGFPNAKNRPGN